MSNTLSSYLNKLHCLKHCVSSLALIKVYSFNSVTMCSVSLHDSAVYIFSHILITYLLRVLLELCNFYKMFNFYVQ